LRFRERKLLELERYFLSKDLAAAGGGAGRAGVLPAGRDIRPGGGQISPVGGKERA
jgi:hypothetical protein